MPEIVLDIDTGGKRRLPAWMLCVSSPDKQKTTQNGDKTCSLLKNQLETQAAGSKCKRILTQDADCLDKLDLLRRCKAKQGTRKASRKCLSLVNSTLGETKTKHKKEADGGEGMLDNMNTTKKQKLRSQRFKNSDLKVPSPGKEDEIELTVEDLVCIAEEYVNADREKQHEHLITRESHSETCHSSLSTSSHVDAGRPIQAAGFGKMLSKCTTSSSSYSTNTERNKEKSPGVENVATNIARTGDAVQDMLDLFIGPLLNKPPAIEQENVATKTESMNIPDETGKQARSREVWSEEGTLSLAKKKSSLKDKVAMFLD